jgi:hypothetical protein
MGFRFYRLQAGPNLSGILIILVIALLGGFSGLGGGPFYGTGYYGGGALGPPILSGPYRHQKQSLSF